MTSKCSEPRNAGARGALKTDLAGRLIASELTVDPSVFQAARLARLFGLTPTRAKLVSELAYEHGRPNR